MQYYTPRDDALSNQFLVTTQFIQCDDPLVFNPNTSVLSVKEAGHLTEGVLNATIQDIDGTKTFLERPICNAIYSGSNSEIVSKGYVDSLVARGITWIAPVESFFDFTSGPPSPLAIGNRYIATVTFGSFDEDFIYEWDGSQWTEIVPTDGMAVYIKDDLSPSFPNECVVFRKDQATSAWVQIGSNLEYSSINNAPAFTGNVTNTTLTYTEASTNTSTGALRVNGGVGIVGDIYMGGDIAGKDARFDKLTLIGTSNNIVMNQGGTSLDGTIAVDELGIVNITSHLEAVKVLPALAAPSIIMASGNQIGLFSSASISVDVNGALTVDNEADIDGMQTTFVKGIKSNYLSMINHTADSTNSTTGALVVSGGVGIGGNLNVGTSLSLSNTLASHTILSTIDSGSVSTGSLVLYGGMAVQKQLKVNGIGRFYSQVNMTGTTSVHTISSTVAAVSTTTGALVIAGGIGVGDGIQCQTLTTRGANGITLYYGAQTGTITCDNNGQILIRSTAGQKVNVNGLLSNDSIRVTVAGNYSHYTDFTVDGSGNLTIAPSGATITSSKTLSLSGTANTHTISSTNDSATTTSGALVIAGGVGIGKTLRVGGEIIYSPLYDDLIVEMSLKAGANAPTWAQMNGSALYCWNFQNTGAFQQLFFHSQLPHKWQEGSNIIPHVHYYAPAAGSGTYAKFNIDYMWVNIDAASGLTSVAGTTTITTGQFEPPATAWTHKLVNFSTVSGTGKTASSIISGRIYRNSTDAQDTYANDIYLVGFDFHILSNKLGVTSVM
jgi:hypothetical protein